MDGWTFWRVKFNSYRDASVECDFFLGAFLRSKWLDCSFPQHSIFQNKSASTFCLSGKSSLPSPLHSIGFHLLCYHLNNLNIFTQILDFSLHVCVCLWKSQTVRSPAGLISQRAPNHIIHSPMEKEAHFYSSVVFVFSHFSCNTFGFIPNLIILFLTTEELFGWVERKM